MSAPPGHPPQPRSAPSMPPFTVITDRLSYFLNNLIIQRRGQKTGKQKRVKKMDGWKGEKRRNSPISLPREPR